MSINIPLSTGLKVSYCLILTFNTFSFFFFPLIHFLLFQIKLNFDSSYEIPDKVKFNKVIYLGFKVIYFGFEVIYLGYGHTEALLASCWKLFLLVKCFLVERVLKLY